MRPSHFLGLACLLGGLTSLSCARGSHAASDDDELETAPLATSADAQRDAIVDVARSATAGRRPGGRCYAAVARYIDTVGYGNMTAQGKGLIGALPFIPNEFHALAHQFADFVNQPGVAESLGLQSLGIDNPYQAPRGAIVVVRAGSPGTHHPFAGDISVADGEGGFFNDGVMGYVSSESFPPGNDFVLGVYVPVGSQL